jgi:16S rRNA (uracil1498-N3)-methyltransferase
MHRFFLPTLLPAVNESVSLLPIHSQLYRVLRVQPGTQIVLLDNAGHERLLEVESVERRDTIARVLEVRPAPAEPALPITLFQCILKAGKFVLVLQKATELGVTAIVPVISNRTVARPGRVVMGKHARWESIVREAAEQSGRGGLPTVAAACTFAEALAMGTGTRLLPWEEGEAHPGLLAALGQATPPVEAVSILIGPEGGLEAGEVNGAIDAGWQVVSLGQRILRAETAAIATVSIVGAAVGSLGDAPLVRVAERERIAVEATPAPEPPAAAKPKLDADAGASEKPKSSRGKRSKAKEVASAG